ncbi:MAG: hypothetical protein WDA16_03805 [Candidatus Thermoplasmatota archaeon]
MGELLLLPHVERTVRFTRPGTVVWRTARALMNASAMIATPSATWKYVGAFEPPGVNASMSSTKRSQVIM